LGIIPAVISTYVGRRMNISTMRRLFLTGERFDSDYAKETGLVDYVTTKEELDDTIKKYVDLLFSSGPTAIKEVKILLDKYEKMSIEDYKKFTIEKISELRVSKEGQEGINAFLEKRKSNWSV
ncbi:MAG: enoyl-CoA hydratase, partial [Thermoplasmata archaeon]